MTEIEESSKEKQFIKQERKRKEPGKEATEKNSEVALSQKDCIINDSLAFADEIRSHTMNEDDVLVSYDVIALSTNVPLDETIKSLVNKAFTDDPNFRLTRVYRKKTFTGLLTNYLSFTSYSYKVGLIRTLVDRAYKINNTWLGLHEDLTKLMDILKRIFSLPI